MMNHVINMIRTASVVPSSGRIHNESEKPIASQRHQEDSAGSKSNFVAMRRCVTRLTHRWSRKINRAQAGAI